jgi:hypothetical protein
MAIDYEHVGVSELRKLNKAALSTLAKVLIVHDHAQPISAIVPYKKFMLWQEFIRRAAEIEAGR